jgi:hypothetical protein
MNRVIAPAALAAVLFAWPASAQQSAGWTEYRPNKTLFTMGYQMSQPLGSFGDYAGASYRGLTFDWQSLIAGKFSAGIRFNWNRYNKEEFSTQTTTSGGTLTGPVFRYADQFALQAVGHYFIDTGRDSIFLPYLGIGLGGAWSNSYQQTIDLTNSQNGFYFVTTPELGLMLDFARGGTTAALNLSVLYNFSTASFRNVSNASAITETIGFTLSY